ncbi:MAG: pantoate--beta-alanine ligase [Planctomycetota bacterium]
MQRITSIDEQRAWSRDRRAAGERIAVVPTMGALHEGHLSLIRLAREQADRVVVTIFLNPTQFDDPGDLDQYPTSLEDDLIACDQLDVDVVFTPERSAMYPSGYATFAEVVGPVNEVMCAVTRPGHFRGVTTVVLKLFHIVEPDCAVFGEKDLQQVLIIGRMIADLDLPIELVVGPTVREPDGLAMSSRNRRLGPEDRAAASAMPQGLVKASRAFADGEREPMELVNLVAEELLMHPGVDVDYAELIDPATFKPVGEQAQPGHVLAVAAFVGGVRLIDHIALGLQTIPGPATD